MRSIKLLVGLLFFLMILGYNHKLSAEQLPECLQSIFFPPTSFLLRSENYDDIQDCIVDTNGLAGQTRFFAAAEEVSGSITGLGILDFPTPNCFIDDETENFLENLGRYLYPLNFAQAVQLINSPNILISPTDSTITLTSSLEFDIHMVSFEQNLVEEYIEYQLEVGQVTQNQLEQINGLFDIQSTSCGIPNSWTVADAVEWAMQVLDRDVLFTSQSDREAIGRAYVFQLHGCSVAEYLEYMDNTSSLQFNEPTPPCFSSIDLTGTWEGTLYQDPGGLAQEYNYRFDFVQTGSLVTGTAQIGYDDFYGIFRIEGEIEGSTLTWSDIEVTDSFLSSGYWCIKSGTLELSDEGNSLSGPWGAPSCSDGIITVFRVG